MLRWFMRPPRPVSCRRTHIGWRAMTWRPAPVLPRARAFGAVWGGARARGAAAGGRRAPRLLLGVPVLRPRVSERARAERGRDPLPRRGPQGRGPSLPADRHA